VCKNCGLFELFKDWYRDRPSPWVCCPHGYESNRKKVDRSEDLAKWRIEYQKAAEERDLDTEKEQKDSYEILTRKFRIRRSLEMHGLPPSCL
jgi:hypothetical protein